MRAHHGRRSFASPRRKGLLFRLLLTFAVFVAAVALVINLTRSASIVTGSSTTEYLRELHDAHFVESLRDEVSASLSSADLDQQFQTKDLADCIDDGNTCEPLPPVNIKRFTGNFIFTSEKWKAGDMIKMPKFLGKEGRARRAARGKTSSAAKTLKWDHIGPVTKNMVDKVMPKKDTVRAKYGGIVSSCAVVGNGGGLLKRRQGDEIDAHDIIIRFNGGPVRGFEKFVGRRTTWRLTNYDHFNFQEPGASPPEDAVLQHITNGVALQRLNELAALPLDKGSPDIHILDPEFQYFAFNAFGFGAPSNGFYGTLLASELCHRITLYGFQKEWKGMKLPYHYYNDIEPNDSQSTRDVMEGKRFQQWINAMNEGARECVEDAECTDPRINRTLTGKRFSFGEEWEDDSSSSVPSA